MFQGFLKDRQLTARTGHIAIGRFGGSALLFQGRLGLLQRLLRPFDDLPQGGGLDLLCFERRRGLRSCRCRRLLPGFLGGDDRLPRRRIGFLRGDTGQVENERLERTVLFRIGEGLLERGQPGVEGCPQRLNFFGQCGPLCGTLHAVILYEMGARAAWQNKFRFPSWP